MDWDYSWLETIQTYHIDVTRLVWLVNREEDVLSMWRTITWR